MSSFSLGSKRANKAGDGRLWSVPEMLEEVLEDYKSGKNRHRKAVLLLLDDKDGEDGKPRYIPTFYQAGMKASQIIGLLAFMLYRFSVRMEQGE